MALLPVSQFLYPSRVPKEKRGCNNMPEISMRPKPFVPNKVKRTYQNCSLSEQHRTCTQREETQDLFAVLQSTRSFR